MASSCKRYHEKRGILAQKSVPRFLAPTCTVYKTIVDKDENYGVIQDLMQRGREREEKKGDVIMTSQICCLCVVLKIPFGKGSCSIGEIAHSASQWWTVISNTKGKPLDKNPLVYPPVEIDIDTVV